MPKPLRETTPVENLLGMDLLDQYMRKARQLYRTIGPGVSIVQWTRARLGKPKRTFKSEFFYYIWEGERWTLYVALRKGFCFEVLPSLTEKEALAAIEELIDTLLKEPPCPASGQPTPTTATSAPSAGEGTS